MRSNNLIRFSAGKGHLLNEDNLTDISIPPANAIGYFVQGKLSSRGRRGSDLVMGLTTLILVYVVWWDKV